MISYAGTYLSEAPPDVVSWCEANVRPRDLYEFPDSTWPSAGRSSWPWQYMPLPSVRLNTLRWPVGASRWAVGHFWASENQLNAIRTNVYPSSGYRKQPFSFSSTDSFITSSVIVTDLWMLPAVPLATAVAGAGLYLLTLVDDRWFWWAKTSTIDVVEGSVTWQSLYLRITQPLGIVINVDPIPSSYLNPPACLSQYNGYLPPMLDAVARSVGQRIVRGLDGSVKAQNALTALTSAQTQLSLNKPKYAGGPYALTPT